MVGEQTWPGPDGSWPSIPPCGGRKRGYVDLGVHEGWARCAKHQTKMDTKGFQSRTDEKQKTMGHALGQGRHTTKEKWVTLWGRGSEQRKKNGSRFGAGAVINEREMSHALGQGK